MGGKTSTSTSQVQVPSDVLARYNSVNAQAQTAASQPFQAYSSDPNAFVAPLSATQQAGIGNTNTAAGQAQPYYQAATAGLLNAQQQSNPTLNRATTLAKAGTNAVNPNQIGADQINQFMSPYLKDVVGSESGLLNQNNQEAMAGQLGNAITSGAFGGDRSGIAAANLSQQQNLANANIYSGLLNQGYNTALGAAQQQQGVNLAAGQANRAAKQWGAGELAGIGQERYGIGANTANSLAGLGAGAQSAGLQGATAQLSAGQQQQSTEQAGLTSLYNQFLQQQAYPFQVSQFLANIAEGTGSLSGSTTTSTQPTGLFGNLLSDRRAKEDIKEVGKAKNGLKIYTFKYKGDPEKVTHLGFMADEVEDKHPEAVGLAGGLKTVDYERAAKADGGGLVFDPNAGAYGLGASAMPGHGTYVPAPQQGAARRIMFQSTPPAMSQKGGLGEAVNDYKSLKGLYSDGSQMWNDGKNVVAGLGGGGGGSYAQGGLALARDDGGPINDPYGNDNEDLARKQAALRVGEGQIAAPNNAANGPVTGALGAQASQSKYSLNPVQPGGGANKSSTGDDLKTLGTMANMASTAAPYVADAAGATGDALASLFLLNRGGLVPREHHADGESVGDTLNTDEFGRPIGDAGPADVPYGRDEGSRPGPGGGAKAPAAGLAPVQTKPYRQRPVYADDAVPTPPARPSDIASAVAAQPGLAAPPVPTSHYQPNGRLGPQMIADNPNPPVAGLSQPDRAMTGLASSPWRPPSYNGPRPDTAPNPASYNIDQGGQAAFIRDYAAYRGVDPKFALGVANAEGLRAINAQNPNGASSVDIDPKTGKPFSFGAFQLNVRNGLGNVAMANGIDPTKPEHANLANKFAIDQMAEGGLKPWRGDAAVTAYQQGNGGNSAGAPNADISRQMPPNAANSRQPDNSGLAGSLSSFLHGQPDGQTSPNGGMGERALMSVLEGLGAVGSYKGQSPLGAILQGLGAGAHGWMDSGKQQADIANQQAHTGLVGAETGRTAVGTVQDALKGPFVIGPDGKPMLKGDYMGSPGTVAGSGTVAKQNGVALPTGPQPYVPPPGVAPPPPPSVGGNDDNGPPPPASMGGIGKASVSRDFAQARSVAGDDATMGKFQERNAADEDTIKSRYDNAHTMGGQLNQLGKELSDLSQDGATLTPGPLQHWKKTLASQWNAALDEVPDGKGAQYKIAPEEVGTSEAAQKMTLGMSFARASSNHQNTIEALETARAATPNGELTPAGIRKIMASMYADKQRDIDQYNYLQQYKDYARNTGGTGKANWYVPQNAIAAFNKEHNDIEYAKLRNSIEQSWKDSYQTKDGVNKSRATGYIEGKVSPNSFNQRYPGVNRVFENN